jgi:hypothetical protein
MDFRSGGVLLALTQEGPAPAQLLDGAKKAGETLIR